MNQSVMQERGLKSSLKDITQGSLTRGWAI